MYPGGWGEVCFEGGEVGAGMRSLPHEGEGAGAGPACLMPPTYMDD